MNAANRNSIESETSRASKVLSNVSLRLGILAAGTALIFAAAGAASAMDQPPPVPAQERPWLIAHMTADMEALGTFDAAAVAKLPGTINAMSDDQVALMSQYYYLTRSKAEQDAYLYALQQQGSTAAQLAAANAQIADLMATMNQEIAACYAQLAALPQPVVYCTQVCYASVPGWCCHVGCFVPEWYYSNGCYVGPCLKLGWSGPWAGPVFKVFFDHHSHFWIGYHKYALAAHISHSTNLAKLHVAELRRGDWHGTLAHDRLVHHTAGIVHTPVVHEPVVHTPVVHEPIVKTHVPTPTHTDAHKTEVNAHKSVVNAHKSVVHEPKPKIESKHVSTSHEHSSKPAAHRAKIASHGHASSHSGHSSHAPSHSDRTGGHKR